MLPAPTRSMSASAALALRLPVAVSTPLAISPRSHVRLVVFGVDASAGVRALSVMAFGHRGSAVGRHRPDSIANSIIKNIYRNTLKMSCSRLKDNNLIVKAPASTLGAGGTGTSRWAARSPADVTFYTRRRRRPTHGHARRNDGTGDGREFGNRRGDGARTGGTRRGPRGGGSPTRRAGVAGGRHRGRTRHERAGRRRRRRRSGDERGGGGGRGRPLRRPRRGRGERRRRPRRRRRDDDGRGVLHHAGDERRRDVLPHARGAPAFKRERWD